jgi:hypothetical protein
LFRQKNADTGGKTRVLCIVHYLLNKTIFFVFNSPVTVARNPWQDFYFSKVVVVVVVVVVERISVILFLRQLETTSDFF